MNVRLIAIGALLLAVSTTGAMADHASATPVLSPDGGHIVEPKAIAGQPHRLGFYPESMIRAHASGVTEVGFIVRKDGTTGDIQITHSSGWRELDQASIEAVAKWRYQPATRDGQPIDRPWHATMDWQMMDTLSPPPGSGDADAIACLNNTTAAITSCTKVIAATSGKVQADAYFHRGMSYDMAGDRDRAAADYAAAVGLDGNHAGAFRGLAVDAEAQGRFQDALTDLNKALAIDPKSDTALAERAYVYDVLGQGDSAKADYKRLADLAPNCAPIHVDNCPRFYRRRVEKADDALKKTPNDVDALNARCAERALTNVQLDLALADCDRAVSLAPNYAPVHDSRAFVYVRLGRYGDGVKEFESIPSKELGSTSLYIRGIARLRTGDNIGGRADLLAAKTLDPHVAADMVWCGIAP
jgi:TonB family protein